MSKVSYLFFMFFLLFNSTIELNLREERLALRQLRSSLGIRSKEWPIRGNSCTDWIGIRCKNGHVTEINISGFQRTTVGQQNPQFSVEALQNFTLLETFNASNFALPGPIPQWFGFKLPSTLQILDLRFCSITGHIPANFGYLSNLTILYLSNNNLTGIVPSGLGLLSSLVDLDLSRNSLISFGSLSNLIMLDMSSNNLSGPIPPSIWKLSKLRILNLLNNSFSFSIVVQGGYLNKVDKELVANCNWEDCLNSDDMLYTTE